MRNRQPSRILSLAAAAALSATSFQRVDAPAPEAAPAQPLGAEPLNLLERYSANTAGRDFVVGDLRGCYAMFQQMLDAIAFDKTTDRMFCTGNLVDSGPDAMACLELIREPWFHSVAGDRETILLRAAADYDQFNWSNWTAQGGAWALALKREAFLELAEEVAELPLAIVVCEKVKKGDETEFKRLFNVIHAEYHGSDEELAADLEHIDTQSPVPPSVTFGTDLIKGRADESQHAGLSTTFVGHTPVEQVGRIGSHVFIDTGAFLAHRAHGSPAHGLTAVEPATGQVFHVKPASLILAA